MRRIFAIATALAIFITGLTALPSWASAPADGTYDCNTGVIQSSPSYPNYTISTGVVSAGAGCAGAVVLPSGVLSIASDGFRGATSITSFNFPSSLSTIGNLALYGTSALTAINVDSSSESFMSVDGVLFDKTQTTLLKYPPAKSGSSYTAPSSITALGDFSFTDANALTSINLPDGVTSLGAGSFSGTGITSFHIPTSVTAIQDYTFQTTPLTTITVPEGVTSIGNFAFYKDYALQSVHLPNSIRSIGTSAFSMNWWETSALTSVNFPDGLISIGQEAFRVTKLSSVTLPGTVTSIGSASFAGMSELTSFTILPGSLLSMGEYTLSGDPKLATVTLPDNITTIGDGVLANDPQSQIQSRIVSIRLPSNLRTIGDYAFEGQNALTSITFPASVTQIGYAFPGATSLATVSFTGQVAPSISGGAFANISVPPAASISLSTTGVGVGDGWSELSVTRPNGTVACGGGGTFTVTNNQISSSTSDCSGAVDVPYGITSIGWAAFWTRAITSVTIPRTVTSIADHAFRQTALTSVTIPASVQSIGELSFATTPLTQLTFESGSSLTTIGNGAFQSSQFTSVTIPASVTSMSSVAFQGNNSLTSLNFSGTIPPGYTWADTPNVQVSGNVSCGTTGYFVITQNMVVGRKDCTGSVDIPAGVTVIAGEAFDADLGYGRGVGRENPYGSTIGTNITSLTIPNTVKSIGWYAFRNNYVTSLSIPDSVTDIGIYAFAFSTATSLTIGNGLTRIQSDAFAALFNLTSLTIGTGVRTIDAEAFRYDRSLTSVTVPDTVDSIGAHAFSDTGFGLTANYCGNADLTGTGLPNPATNAATCVPAPPLQLSVVPGDASALFTFTPGASGASTVTNYKYSLNGTTYTPLSPAVTSSPITIHSLTNGTQYTIYLKATSSMGDSAAVSALVTPRSAGQATVPVDGTYDCNTGLPTSSAPNYTITNGAAHDGSACVGAVVVANGTTSIRDWTFGYASAITSVYIPESVTAIGGYVFANSGSLFAINVATDNSDFSSIGGVLFNKTQTTLIKFPEGKNGSSFAVPDGVTGIDDFAFYKTSSLTSVTLPSSLRTIGTRAFALSGLTSMVVPQGVTTLADHVFEQDTQLISVVLPSSLTAFGEGAFVQDYSLTTINIPNSITVIPNLAFFQDVALTSLNLPQGVTSIGDYAFEQASLLSTINFPSALRTIGIAAFSGTAITSVVLPEGFTTIGSNAFQWDSGITTVTLPSTLRTITDAAFYGVSHLTQVTIPDGVEYIGGASFLFTGSPFTLYYCGNASLSGTGLPSQATNAATCRPAPPTQLGATAGDGSASISFTPGATGGSAITGYEYSLDGTNYSAFSPSLTTASGTLSGLTNGTTYSVYLKAVSSLGESVASAPVSVTPLASAYSSASIAGVAAPVYGATPVRSGISGTGYTGTVSWSGNPTTFAGATSYTATITLTPRSGYSFAGVTANYFTLSGATSVSNSAGSGLITAVFPATDRSAYSSPVIGGITVPVLGATPVSSVTSTSGYTGTVSWSGNPTTFAGATSYTATITLTPRSGYTFTGVAANFFTVAGATSVSNSAGSGVITAVFPATERSAGSSSFVGGVAVPVFGATPVSSVTSTSGYTGTVSWSGSPSIFAGGTSYTATITLTPRSGYSFAGVTANYFTLSGATSVSNDAGSGVITAVFPATDASAYSDPAVVGLTAPVFGATPVSSVTSTSGYTGTVSWSSNPTTFAASQSYTATVTLTPAAGYSFVGLPANYFTVAGATSVSNSAGSAVITVVFPATVGQSPGQATQVVATRTGLTTATVDFVAPTSDGGSAITGYTISAYGDNGVSVNAGPNDSEVTLTGLIPTSSYGVKVVANNANGSSADAWAAQDLVPGPFDATSGDGAIYCLADGQTAGAGYALVISHVLEYELNCQGALVIPTGVTSLDTSALQGASDITSISIPDSVTSIGNYAMDNMSGLTSLTIPNSVTHIGDGAFRDMSSLTSLSIGSGITEISLRAFYGATSISSLDIPATVTTIDPQAFLGLYNLTSLTLHPGLLTIGDQAFSNAISLQELQLPTGLQSIGYGSFCGAESLTSLAIPEGITAIQDEAFCDLSSVTWVSIPSSVVSLGEYAFGGANSLVSVYFLGNAPTVGQDFEPFGDAAAGAEAVISQTATDFGIDPTWQGLTLRSVAAVQPPGASQQQNQQQQQNNTVVAAPAPLPRFDATERQKVSTFGQSLTLDGENLGDVLSIKIGGKEAKISKKTNGQIVIDVPASTAGFPDIKIVSSAGTIDMQGLIQVVAPAADKRTQNVSLSRNGQLTDASLATLKKVYQSATPATAITCLAKVASNASSKDVALARKNAKATCQALVDFSSFINSVNVQVSKTGRPGAKIELAVTFDRPVLGN